MTGLVEIANRGAAGSNSSTASFLSIPSEVWGVIIGAAIGALATILIAQRNLRATNIAAERTKWREKIRSIANDVTNSQSPNRNKSWVGLALNTNPLDNEDIALVKLARKLGKLENLNDSDEAELVSRFALLLKHDWERAKIEASWFPMFLRCCNNRTKFSADLYK